MALFGPIQKLGNRRVLRIAVVDMKLSVDAGTVIFDSGDGVVNLDVTAGLVFILNFMNGTLVMVFSLAVAVKDELIIQIRSLHNGDVLPDKKVFSAARIRFGRRTSGNA